MRDFKSWFQFLTTLFGKLQGSVRGSFAYTKFNQLINDIVSVNENYNQTYTTSIRSNFLEAPNFEVSYRYSIQDSDQGSTRTKFYTNAPTIEFDALIFKKLTFKTDYTYSNLRNEDETINSFDLWNASLAYRKTNDSKWEYELKATNLLDTATRNQTNNGTFSVSTSQYYIQPRFLTLRVIYNL